MAGRTLQANGRRSTHSRGKRDILDAKNRRHGKKREGKRRREQAAARSTTGKNKIQAEMLGVKGAHAMGLGGRRDKLNKRPHPSSSHGSLRRCATADAQEVPGSSAADARLEGDSEWD